MKNKWQRALGISFALYISCFFAFQVIAKDQSFSELENRNLSLMPELTTDTLLDGSFAEAFETYIADQFPLRNRFIAIKSNTERALLKKENNGVFLGKDGYLLQDFETPDLELAARNADYITSLSEHFTVYTALAPTATSILKDKLPTFAQPYDELGYIQSFYDHLGDQVHQVDLAQVLAQHKNEPIYYKTDHHWTTLGAYYGYTAFCEAAGITPLTLDDFNIETVSTDFYGSLFSKGNFTFIKPDSLQLFYPKQAQPVTVTYEATGKVTDSLYDYSYLDVKDKYSLFLDNNHPLIKIQTSAGTGKKLLVIKDSYANCFVPFLTAHYDEIQIADLRLLTLPIKTYATQHAIDDILLLYNVQNFSAEGKLSLLKQ